MRYPYEFLVEIPYGQAGRDLALTASATEKRLSGTPRSVHTPAPTVVHVIEDTLAPVIVVRAPAATGATVVEHQGLRFDAEVTDNVRVSTVRIFLLADKNSDGEFTPEEEVLQRLLLNPPFHGTLLVGTIEGYLGSHNETVDQLALLLRIQASDGQPSGHAGAQPAAGNRANPDSGPARL
jgi:hypothetical protein